MVVPVQRAWLFESLAVTVEVIGFLDPALVDHANARERGVRIGVMPLAIDTTGIVCVHVDGSFPEARDMRIDLLESQPNAANQMSLAPNDALG